MRYHIKIVASRLTGDEYHDTVSDWSMVMPKIQTYLDFKKRKYPDYVQISAETER